MSAVSFKFFPNNLTELQAIFSVINVKNILTVYGICFQCLKTGKKFQQTKLFSMFFFQKIDTDISCKLPLSKTIYMKFQSLFSGKYKQNVPSVCRVLNLSGKG